MTIENVKNLMEREMDEGDRERDESESDCQEDGPASAAGTFYRNLVFHINCCINGDLRKHRI